MKIVKRISEKEQYFGQVIFLMECGNGHQFEMDGLLKKNCIIHMGKDDYGNKIATGTQAVCPKCGDDDTKIEQLNISG